MGRPALARSDAVVTVIFVTHATSDDNEGGLASGHFDPPLSELGRLQAADMGDRYRDHDPAAVFCSDLQRSYRTAEIAFTGRDLSIIRDPRLRECDYGRLTRHPSREVEEVRAEHVNEPFPGGESYVEAAERVRQFLSTRLPAYEGKQVMIVGHRATRYALDHLINGMPLGEAVTAHWTWQPGWVYHFYRPS